MSTKAVSVFALVTVALAVLVGSAAAEQSGTEALVRAAWLARRPALFAAVADNANCEKKADSCVDCTTRRKCANIMNNWVQVSTSACPSSTPYCSPTNGTCSTTVPNEACASPPTADTFTCPADGYWPDVQTCTKYYLCVGDTAYAFDCSGFPGTVYDHRTTRCVPKSRSQCFALRCSDPDPNKPVVYTPYTPAPWVYAVCTSKDASTALVGACDEGQAMDVTTNQCEAACNDEGRFKNPKVTDDVSYYDCVDLGGGKLSRPIPNKCPTGSTFVAAQQRCVVPAAAATDAPAASTDAPAATVAPAS